MATVSVRYIVDDVDVAISFYTQHLGFDMDLHPAPTFAILSRGDLRLLLNAPTGPGGAAQPMPDGRKPEPGGWNRIQLPVDDLATQVETLRRAGLRFRNDIRHWHRRQADPAGRPCRQPHRAVRTPTHLKTWQRGAIPASETNRSIGRGWRGRRAGCNPPAWLRMR